jgi:hypothetical protein
MTMRRAGTCPHPHVQPRHVRPRAPAPLPHDRPCARRGITAASASSSSQDRDHRRRLRLSRPRRLRQDPQRSSSCATATTPRSTAIPISKTRWTMRQVDHPPHGRDLPARSSSSSTRSRWALRGELEETLAYLKTRGTHPGPRPARGHGCARTCSKAEWKRKRDVMRKIARVLRFDIWVYGPPDFYDPLDRPRRFARRCAARQAALMSASCSVM